MLNNPLCQNKTDEELVALTLKDKQYFVCLVRNYENKLLRYIQRISSFGPDEAQDILQEVFIKIYQNLNAFDKSLKFSSWAYRICHNQVISHWRKTKSRPEVLDIDLNQDFIQNLAANSDSDIEKSIDQKKLEVQIAKVLGKIDLKYREVLILKFLEDKSYREISDILKKPEGTVATLINRAKKELKKQINNLVNPPL